VRVVHSDECVLRVCAHGARPPSNMIQLGFKYEVYHLKGG
jgi:hypothetical protein